MEYPIEVQNTLKKSFLYKLIAFNFECGEIGVNKWSWIVIKEFISI